MRWNPRLCGPKRVLLGQLGPIYELVEERIAMRAALYLRVSTTDQTTENQERELRAAADRLGHVIVEVYRDHGISGGKGREKRPAFDKLHRDATLRKFDLVMAWSVDRLGRSLQDLVHFLDHLRATRVELFLHQQGLDTTSPAGRAMFRHALGVQRVRAGDHPGAHRRRDGAGEGQGHQERKADRPSQDCGAN